MPRSMSVPKRPFFRETPFRDLGTRPIYMVFTDSEKHGIPNVNKFETEHDARQFASRHNGRLRPTVYV